MEGRDLRKYTAVPYHSAHMTAPTTVERRPQRRTAPTVPHRDNLKAVIFDKGTNAYYNTEPYTFSTDGDCLDTEVFSYTAESFGFSAGMHGMLRDGQVNVVLGIDCDEGTQTPAGLPPTLKLRAIRDFRHLPLNQVCLQVDEIIEPDCISDDKLVFAPMVYKCTCGLHSCRQWGPERLVDSSNADVVYWSEVMSGGRSMRTLPKVFSIIVEGKRTLLQD